MDIERKAKETVSRLMEEASEYARKNGKDDAARDALFGAFVNGANFAARIITSLDAECTDGEGYKTDDGREATDSQGKEYRFHSS